MIIKAKAKSWQKTSSSLSPKTRPSEVFFLIRSIFGSSSPTSSDLANFPSCHTPVDCANHLSSHLQSHFSIQTPKRFRSTEKAQMNHIRTAHCNTLHPTFCSPFSSLELSTAISQLLIKLPTLFYPTFHNLRYIFFYISSTFLGQLTPSRLPGNNQQSFPFSNPENPLTHLLHIDPSLLLPAPPNSSKNGFRTTNLFSRTTRHSLTRASWI